MNWEKDEFTISTDRARLQFDVIQQFLAGEAYWAKSRTPEQTRTAIENSLCFGLYAGDSQIGFARVITDHAVFAYIGDVFIIDEFRGRGLSKWLMEIIVTHPDLQGLRRWLLATKDAQGLYKQFGFEDLRFPERWMERPGPDAY